VHIFRKCHLSVYSVNGALWSAGHSLRSRWFWVPSLINRKSHWQLRGSPPAFSSSSLAVYPQQPCLPWNLWVLLVISCAGRQHETGVRVIPHIKPVSSLAGVRIKTMHQSCRVWEGLTDFLMDRRAQTSSQGHHVNLSMLILCVAHKSGETSIL
jgi:hypothetical protein